MLTKKYKTGSFKETSSYYRLDEIAQNYICPQEMFDKCYDILKQEDEQRCYSKLKKSNKDDLLPYKARVCFKNHKLRELLMQNPSYCIEVIKAWEEALHNDDEYFNKISEICFSMKQSKKSRAGDSIRDLFAYILEKHNIKVVTEYGERKSKTDIYLPDFYLHVSCKHSMKDRVANDKHHPIQVANKCDCNEKTLEEFCNNKVIVVITNKDNLIELENRCSKLKIKNKLLIYNIEKFILYLKNLL